MPQCLIRGWGGGHECGFTHRISSAEMKIYGVWSSWLFIWLTHPVESYMQLSANAPPCVPQFLPSPCRSQGLSKPPDERHPWLAGPPVWVATAPAPGLEIHQPCPQTDLLLRLRCVCVVMGEVFVSHCVFGLFNTQGRHPYYSEVYSKTPRFKASKRVSLLRSE